MVFGNINDNFGVGVCFMCNLVDGVDEMYGEYFV